MTCYEKLKNGTKSDEGMYNRLNSYFHALENNQLDVYHDRREKRKKYRHNQEKLQVQG